MRFALTMKPAVGLAMVGAMSACATSAPLPTVAAPEAVIKARLYDLGSDLGSGSGSSAVLAAGFGGDARASGTFFVSLPEGDLLLGRYETIAESGDPAWGAIFRVRSREYSTEEVVDGEVLMGVATARRSDDLMVECEYVTSNRVATGHGYCDSSWGTPYRLIF